MGLLSEVVEAHGGHVQWHAENDVRIVRALKHNKHRTDALVAVVRELALLLVVWGAACLLCFVAVVLLWSGQR